MDKEKRFIDLEELEIRIENDDDGVTIRGHAAVFGKKSVDLGGFREVISPGAFTRAIKKSNVRALFNHDPNMILGRTPKTLRLEEDKKGLAIEIDPPDTQVGRDVVESIRRRDITGMSFAFITKTDSWNVQNNEHIRTIEEVDELFDIGPVTYPAYPQTDVAARSAAIESLEAWKKSEEAWKWRLGLRRKNLDLRGPLPY